MSPTSVRSARPRPHHLDRRPAAARRRPACCAVFTAADVDLAPHPGGHGHVPAAMSRPFLATDTVRFVGEPVAAIVTETREPGRGRGRAGGDRLRAADRRGRPRGQRPAAATLLFPDARHEHRLRPARHPTRRHPVRRLRGRRPPARSSTAGSRPCPLEVRGAAARWEPDGRLDLLGVDPGAARLPAQVAAVSGSAAEQVQVIAPDVGGGFGAKIGVYPEEILCLAGPRVGRPVRVDRDRARRPWSASGTAGARSRWPSSAARATAGSTPTA